ncbi:MAG: hypothetical protein ACFFA1_06780 [Promethearchaeota archaeon]
MMEIEMIKILKALDRASCACPLEYIALHTNIIQPLEIMKALEKEGYCCQSPVNGWSASGHPRFEITPLGRGKLRELEANVLQIPLRIVLQKLAQT